MSVPILGMLTGMLVGIVLGTAAVSYFELSSPLEAFCLVSSVLMIFQLLGATIGATIGKPHDDI